MSLFEIIAPVEKNNESFSEIFLNDFEHYVDMLQFSKFNREKSEIIVLIIWPYFNY